MTKLKRLFISAFPLLIAAFFITSASAADFPYSMPTFKARAASYDWTGGYVGLYAGGSSSKVNGSEQSITTTGGLLGIKPGSIPATTFPGADSSSTMSGFTGGFTAGYMKQFGPVVVGLETEFGGAGSTRTDSFAGSAMGPIYTTKQSTGWLGSTYGKAGIAVDRVLFYGLGGVAYGTGTGELTIQPGAAGKPVGSPFNQKLSRTFVGYTFGGGVEYAFDDHWRIGAQYQYINLGCQNFDYDFGTAGTAHTKACIATNTGLASLKYSF